MAYYRVTVRDEWSVIVQAASIGEAETLDSSYLAGITPTTSSRVRYGMDPDEVADEGGYWTPDGEYHDHIEEEED